jgi:hypothetical protein
MDTDDGNLFPVRKHNPASLTQEEVADIMQLADASGISDIATAKLLVRFRERKKAAYANRSSSQEQ